MTRDIEASPACGRASFDKVTVNVENGKLRANRLRLLNEIESGQGPG